MRIPKIPAEYSATLPAERGADAPVFHYTFDGDAAAEHTARFAMMIGPHLPEVPEGATPEQIAEIENRPVSAAAAAALARFHADVFNAQITRIDNLLIGDEPFDRNAEGHLRSIPGAWKIAIGREIYSRARRELTEAEEGN